MTTPRMRIARTLDDLNRINTPDTNAVFLPRRVSKSLEALIHRELADIDEYATELEIESVAEADVRQAVKACGTEKNIPVLANIDKPQNAELWRAIYQLVQLYHHISGDSRVTLALHINTHHAPSFHLDGYPHIVTRTLVGNGTLWVPNSEVSDDEREFYFYKNLKPEQARQVPCGWIVAERGYKDGFIHSSPSGNAGTRLFIIALNRKNPVLPYLFEIEPKKA